MFDKFIDLKSFFLKISWIKFFYFLMLLTGLYYALKITFGLFQMNSDAVDTAMLWYGVHDYGWKFIESWVYNYDNWLFSLFSFHYLLFEIFSPSSVIVMLSGYLIFLANIFICAFIAQTINAKNSIFFITLFLLFSSKIAHALGLLTFSVSHNITNFYGLLSLLFTLRWVKHHKNFSLIMIFFSTVVAGLSDPWYLPTYFVPLTLSMILLAVINRKIHRRLLYVWFGVMFFAFLIIFTQVFGLLSFLPKTTYKFANWHQITVQGLYVIKNLGYFLNLLPLFHLNSFYPNSIFSLTLILILIAAFVLTDKKKLINEPDKTVFFLTIVFSITIILISFCLCNNLVQVFEDLAYSRYFLNIYILIILGLTVCAELYWNDLSKLFKIVLSLTAILYMTSSLISSFYLIRQPLVIPENQYKKFTNFLSSHNLTYGYAGYWFASIITFYSKNTIQVRPVSLYLENNTLIHGGSIQASKLWYLPTDAPPNQKNFFIYIEDGGSFCISRSLFLEKISKQYGPPEKILTYQNGILFIWNHPLF